MAVRAPHPLDQPARLAQAIRDFTVDVSGWVSSQG